MLSMDSYQFIALLHSWEVILLNNSFGLGDQSEEGLEALNKNIRHMRSKGARKDSTVYNFTDTNYIDDMTSRLLGISTPK